MLAGRYEVGERLGRGGMGEVWSARDRVLQRDVALKLLPLGEGSAADLTARFEREAVAAAQINHPNVVALYDRGVHDGTLFLTMELVDGVPLSALIKTSGVLPPDRALELAEQVCAALEATHAAGVVHFDIKPRNVMITTAGVAKVVDFGIAGFLQARRLSVVDSSRLAPAATLEYAAPEQLTAERGDARSDLYALGGVLFTMLTGRAPFTGDTAWEVMAAKATTDAPRLELARPGTPPPLADLVARLLARAPEARPQSAWEVRERLAELRTGVSDPGTTSIEALSAPPTERQRPSGPVGGGGPRQLPPDTGLFTGRARELETLLALSQQTRTAGAAGTVVISAIDGMGGIGKTALAIRAAHRLAPNYPDGQLFLDLYGFTQGTAPRDPGDALAALLGGLGVPPQKIPADTDSRAAYYRDRLAGSRTLILLDNAADEAQVRPLLPATEACLVLVTSRRRLKALDDALPLPLDVLPQPEAVALLRKAARLGEHEREQDQPLLEQAAELCGHLPLALLIAGALLRTGGEAWNLSILIDRLTARRPGQELAAYTDETRSVEAVFDLSYRQLPEDLQLLFRRLGLHPGPEIDAHAAAALLDSDPDTAARALQRLADHSLLIAAGPGRYRLHDLIRAHARSLAVTLDPEAERAAPMDRLLRYYAHTAQRATLLVARHPRPEPDGASPSYSPALSDPEAARSWLRTEHANLDAAFTHAHAEGRDIQTSLAAGLAEILLSDGPWSRALDIHQAAAQAADAQGDRVAQSAALTDLGRVRQLIGDYPGAGEAIERALEISRAAGDRSGEANALNDLGRVRYMTGDYAESMQAHAGALALYRELGHRHGEATALNDLGEMQYLSGENAAAAETLTRALEIFRELGHRHGEATALASLGNLRHLLGDFPGAIEALGHALESYRELGLRLGEANALTMLGQVQLETGDLTAAATSLVDAMEICRAAGHRGGEANALTNLGRVRQADGDYAGAVAALEQALENYRELGDRGNESWALNHFASALAASGRRVRAFELYQQARAMNRELDKPDDEAVALEGLADHYQAEGDNDQAAARLREALTIYERIGMHADAKCIRDRLLSFVSSRLRG
ncbi:serine/threonine-protein kinase [Actinospica robiniae]|uniref:serine/threonine-protein kinase n=1 Tax=Actinospica robiniae TaxID=304901 RepID=UPI0012FAC50A|nr:serine/threonine-protein kinase [Actinospica robiniae]